LQEQFVRMLVVPVSSCPSGQLSCWQLSVGGCSVSSCLVSSCS